MKITCDTFFNLQAKENKRLYFALKNKNGYSMTMEDQQKWSDFFLDYLGSFDFVAVPETKNTFLLDLASRIGQVVTIRKRTQSAILEMLEQANLQKSERNKLAAIMADNHYFRMNLIPGNQRHRFSELAFDSQELNEGTVLLLDDAVFSGASLNGSLSSLPRTPNKVVALFAMPNENISFHTISQSSHFKNLAMPTLSM